MVDGDVQRFVEMQLCKIAVFALVTRNLRQCNLTHHFLAAQS